MLEEIKESKKKRTTKKIQSKTKSKKPSKQAKKPFGASYKRNEWKKNHSISKRK